MSRCIDADALAEEWRGSFYEGTVESLLNTAPTIEPRCETCEAFNKTRLLIPQPQPQRTGRWIEIGTISHSYICSVCGRMLVNITDGKNKVAEHYPFCHCGARMEDEG